MALKIAVICILVFAGVLGDCPSGWLRAGDYCYWLSQSLVSFEDAQGLCATKEASLVSLSTSLDVNATKAVLGSSPGVTQTWTCLLFDPSVQTWTWLDGSHYDAHTVPWWAGQEPPLHSTTTEACAVLDASQGKLHRSACTQHAASVCRRSAYKRELCKEEEGWNAIGNSCYKTFQDSQTWMDADKTCRDHSATLLPLPFTDALRSVIQQSVVCDTSDNDVWISTPNVTATTAPLTASAQCNYVSVMYNQILVSGACLEERKFICVKKPGSCAEGWLSYEGRCYRSVAQKRPWLSALMTCHDQGADFLVISSEKEHQFIETQMIAGTLPQKMWLGLSDMANDGQLIWNDGSHVLSNSTHWQQGYPVNTSRLDCGIIQLGTTKAYWIDSYCYQSLPYVCEMSIGDDVKNRTHTNSCAWGWQYEGTACYLMGSNKNYTAAESFCTTSGGALATVQSPEDQAALADIIPDISTAWIGLRRDDLSNTYVWEDGGTLDGTLANWLHGVPDASGGGGQCVQIVGAANSGFVGAWISMDCSSRADFVCQRPLIVSGTTQLPPNQVTVAWSPRCGEGWLLSNILSACYMLVTDVSVPWAAARAHCRRRGGDLVSISNNREQTQVEVMVRSAGLAEGVEAWSGIWIGATDNSREGGWEWSDSAPFRYLQWSAGQPDNRGWGGEEQDCAVAMPAATLAWDDRDCGELHNFMCKKAAAPLTTVAPVSGKPTSSTSQCPGWALLSGDYSVTDSMLVASSSSDPDHSPAKSRINPGNGGAWMSTGTDSTPWIGVHFETLVTVKGVTTTGAGTQQTWVTQYKLQYRYDSSAPLYWYSNPPGSGAKVFTGNTDSNTQVTNTLALPFAARQVFLYPVHWTGSAPSLRWELKGCIEDECSPEYAVSGPLIVPDDNITASSSSDPAHTAANARLHRVAASTQLTCWRPVISDSSQWIQVDFERVEVLRGISTRGNPTAAEWVISYLLLYQPEGSEDGVTFKPYEEPYGNIKPFVGNVNNNSTVTNYLKSHIPSRRVRLQPQAFNGHIALQFDILVCEAGCQEHALLHDVSDEQLSATSSQGPHGPKSSRLSPGPFQGPSPGSGGWQAEFPHTDQYIQVSLNVPLEIRAVATQGRHGSNSWVTHYFLSSSLDSRTWTNYTYSNKTVVLTGNYDADSVHKHYLTPFLARYVRLHPTDWHSGIALRWELYGCPGKNGMQEIGCFTDHPDNRDLPYEPYTDPTDGMDPLLCSRHCFGKGYYYAGLQARDQCYCGNSYGRYGASPDCNLKCFPQVQFTCGGLTANNIYSTGLTSNSEVCPPGWKKLGQQCYSYFNMPSDWTTARATCRDWTGDLASVADNNVNLMLYNIIGIFSDQTLAWIGLNDLRESRYFEWSNEEEVVYIDWDLHQPPPVVSGENRHCVAINNKTGAWVVEECDRHLPFICVTYPRPSAQPTQAVAPEGCQQGMFAYMSYCYVITEENRTKSDADDVCASFSGQVVTVKNRFEQAFLTSLLSGRSGLYWTDVSDLHDPGRFTYSQGQYDITYTNWDSNMPDSRRLGHCVAMAAGRRAGLWSNQQCSGSFKAICKVLRDGFTEPVVPTRPSGVCKTNWISSNSSLCYQVNNVNSNLQRTWPEAREDCTDQRGDLASFVGSVGMESFWRQKLLGSSNHFWIGLHALPSGVLQWSDRTAVTLDGPWAAGQPDTRNGTQNCVELHVTSGTLSFRDCSLRRNWLCAVPKGVTPFQRMRDRVTPTAGPAGSCLPLDDTWKRYGDFCYKVSTQPATWRQARTACQQSGADLASINGIQENLFVYSLAQKTSQLNIWIGLNELMSPRGYYGWSDGSAVSFVNWDGNGPDDANGQESCAEMFVRTGKWNDKHCALSQGYACKRNMAPTVGPTPSKPPSEDGGCNDGWTVFETRCYLVRTQQPLKTWEEAVQECSSLTTPFARVSLASVRSARENAFLTVQLYNIDTPVWVGLRMVNQNYLWLDNEELLYTNWDIGEPNGDEQTGCVHLYSQGANAGLWDDADCSLRMGYVCESPRFPYWNVPTPTPSRCPNGFVGLGNSCYWFSDSVHLSWAAAENNCQFKHAHLVTISSLVEQDYVYLGITGGDPKYYKPPKANFTYPAAWLGLRGTQVDDGIQWNWADGWPVSFTNWAPGGSLNISGTNGCTTMNANGTWQSQDCNVSRPFVCKITSDTPPFTPDPSRGVCDGQQWATYGAGCYAFHLAERVSFAHAAFSCSQDGASLVSIHSLQQNIFLQTTVQAMSTVPVWIGFKRSDNGHFAWRDGSGVDYTFWDSNYPKDASSDGMTGDCAQLSPRSGRWLNAQCTALYGYICEKKKVFETTRSTLANHPAPAAAIGRGRSDSRSSAHQTAHAPTTAHMTAQLKSSATTGVTGGQGPSGTSGMTAGQGSSGTSGVTAGQRSSGTSGVTAGQRSSGTSGVTAGQRSSGTSGVTAGQGSSGTSGVTAGQGSSGTSGVTAGQGSSGTSSVTTGQGSPETSGVTEDQGSPGTSGVTTGQGSSGTSNYTGPTSRHTDPSPNTGAIAGGVVAGVVLLVLISVGIVLFLRRRRKKSVEITARALYEEANNSSTQMTQSWIPISPSDRVVQ